MKNIHKWLLGLSMSAMPFLAIAQEKEINVDELVEARTYVFTATTAMPMRGNVIQLTSPYTVTINKDSIDVWLPYFGRAFTAPINTTDGGIKLTSTNFSYDMQERKNGRKDVSIIPKNDRNTRQLNLSISDNGYATLNVTSNNRDAISFYGRIAAIPKAKE